jgi:hypothetical protein
LLSVSAVHELLVFASVEEGARRVLSETVVRVHELLRVSSLRDLNVPECVVRNRVENAFGRAALHAWREGLLKVLHEAVLLSLLEDGELLVEDILELVQGKRRGCFEVLQEGKTDLVHLLL